jgi:DNA processing protein
LGTEPEAKNFPPRNRIISGLSLGVVIVEAGDRSGATITSQFALDQGREVFAVPGNVNSPASRGTNRLIQQGAKLITRADDVLEELNLSMVFEHSAVQKALPETEEEAALFEHLSTEPIHIDGLSRATGLTSQEVSSTLTLLELKGIVRQVGGMNYVMVREPDAAYDT